MIKVIFTANFNRTSNVFAPDTTLREALNSLGADITRGMTLLDGGTLQASDLDKKLSEFGGDTHNVSNIAKVDNANA